MEDYYKILGVDRKATTMDIKNAFRNLAKKFHPDKNKSFEAHEIFVKINLAYENLKDKTSREKYDEEYAQFLKRKTQDERYNSTGKERYYDKDWARRQEEFKKKAESYSAMDFGDFEGVLDSIAYVGKKIKRGAEAVWGFVLLVVFGFFSFLILVNIFSTNDLGMSLFLLFICLAMTFSGWLKIKGEYDED